jgi:hypothetical protein
VVVKFAVGFCKIIRGDKSTSVAAAANADKNNNNIKNDLFILTGFKTLARSGSF